jgi:hypothetical protein
MGVYYMGIKIFNKLPVHIANLVMDKKHFILVLKKMFNYSIILFS